MDDVAAYGLHDVEPNPSFDDDAFSEGIALWTPTPKYPALDGSTHQRRVTFRLALASHPEETRQLRQNLRLLSSLTRRSSGRPGLSPISPPSSSSSSAPPFNIALHILPLSPCVVARWHTVEGEWVLCEVLPGEETLRLDDFWRETVGKVARKLRRSDVRQGNVKGKRREEGRAQVVNGGEVRGDEEEQEWVWGEKERLKAYGDAVEVLVQLARILVCLHQHDLALRIVRPDYFQVHRDPSGSIRVVLVRFPSIVRLRSSKHFVPTSTSSTSTVHPEDESPPSQEPDGSEELGEDAIRQHCRYLAPETLSRKPVISQGSDCYGLGCLAYELLTDGPIESPPTTNSLLTIIHQHIVEKIPHIDSIRLPSSFPPPPKSLSSIVMLCLAKKNLSEERYTTSTGLLYDLLEFQRIARSGSLEEEDKFEAGKIERMSRFEIGQGLVARGEAVAELNRAFDRVINGCSSIEVVSIRGVSGSGKSKLVSVWLDSLGESRRATVALSKLDQYLRRPLGSFLDCFIGVVQKVLAQPSTDVEALKDELSTILSGQGGAFASLLPIPWRRFFRLEVSEQADRDWSSLISGFRVTCRRLLHVLCRFGSALVLVIDDTQWLPPEDRDLWQEVLDPRSSSFPLKNLLVLTLSRTESEVGSSPETVLSPDATSISLSKFDPFTVSLLLKDTFSWTDAELQQSRLNDFLWDETQGSPLFLMSLISSLVRDKVIFFDFSVLKWKVDSSSTGLIAHTSHGIETYVSRVLGALPESTQSLLKDLSCLPSSAAVPIGVLASISDVSIDDAESYLLPAVEVDAVHIEKDGHVRFTHDRHHQGARSLIRREDLGRSHHRIGSAILRLDQDRTMLFECVDNFLEARRLGFDFQEEMLPNLLCQAARRSSEASSFSIAANYLSAIELFLDLDSTLTWQTRRSLCMDIVKLLAEIGAVQKDWSAVDRLKSFVVFCSNSRLDQVRIRTIISRFLIHASAGAAGVEYAFETIRLAGFDPRPGDGDLASLPTRLDKLFDQSTPLPSPSEEAKEEREVSAAIIYLCASIGNAVFFATEDKGRGATLFAVNLALTLETDFALQIEGLPYLLARLPLGWEELPFDSVRAFVEASEMVLAKQMSLTTNRYSLLKLMAACTGLIQKYRFQPWRKNQYDQVFDMAQIDSNQEFLSYVVLLAAVADVAAFSRKPLHQREDWGRYFHSLPTETRILASSALTLEHDLASDNSVTIFSRLGAPRFELKRDLPSVQHSPIHTAGCLFIAMRTSWLFDSDGMLDLVREADRQADGAFGFVMEPEFLFLMSAGEYLYGDDRDRERADSKLEKLSLNTTTDCKVRENILRCLKQMRKITESSSDWTLALPTIESTLSLVDNLNKMNDFDVLVGKLNVHIARFVLKESRMPRLAAGFALEAFRLFSSGSTGALARSVVEEFPFVPFPSSSGERRPSAQPPAPTPPLARHDSSSRSRSKNSSKEITMISEQLENKLDLESVLNAAVVIASTKDSGAICVRLMRILSQYTRSDYIALALHIDGELVLRGSGASELSAHHVSLNSPEARSLAPVSVLLSVARTGQSITSIDILRQLDDPFYRKSERLPQSILALPFSNQGRFAGVVVLQSQSIIIDLPSYSQEVASTLATLAAVSLEASQSREGLERIVAARTSALEAALRAKTSFLSHMSHELRSPLFAVLGLVEVLEGSSGLSQVQLEHLSTIKQSGEALQGIINNLLDLTKLEAGSVELEHVDFRLRDMIEGALDQIAPIAQKKEIEVVYNHPISDDPPLLIGDPFRLRQILTNFLSNALKFTPSTGSVTVRMKKTSSTFPCLIEVSVQDTGSGIPEDKRHRLFKNFSQVDESITREHGGSGLGLSISRTLSRLLGGDCWAESEVGRGSTFFFSFWAVASVSQPPPDPYPRLTPPSRSSFLLCPPESSREVLQSSLTHFGIDLEMKQNLEETLKALRKEQFDIIFLNPSLIDKEAQAEIHRLQPKAVVFYTAQLVDLGQVMTRLSLPHDALVPRPFKAGALYAAVKNALMPPTERKKKPINKMDADFAKRHPIPHILFVDDQPVNRAVGSKILSKFGYSCDLACDGQEAVDAAEKKAYDLIFLDLQMPVKDGHSANQAIKSSSLAGSPLVCALTANSDTDTRDQCLSEGFFGFLSKPLVIPLFTEILSQASEITLKRSA